LMSSATSEVAPLPSSTVPIESMKPPTLR
jgi:hypothetical protein